MLIVEDSEDMKKMYGIYLSEYMSPNYLFYHFPKNIIGKVDTGNNESQYLFDTENSIELEIKYKTKEMSRELNFIAAKYIFPEVPV